MVFAVSERTSAGDLWVWTKSPFSARPSPPHPTWGSPLCTLMSISSSSFWPWYHPEQEGLLPLPSHISHFSQVVGSSPLGSGEGLLGLGPGPNGHSHLLKVRAGGGDHQGWGVVAPGWPLTHQPFPSVSRPHWVDRNAASPTCCPHLSPAQKAAMWASTPRALVATTQIPT